MDLSSLSAAYPVPLRCPACTKIMWIEQADMPATGRAVCLNQQCEIHGQLFIYVLPTVVLMPVRIEKHGEGQAAPQSGN